MKNKILSILLSAVIAFALWVYVITVISPESEKTYYNIPVVLQNIDTLDQRGLMIVSENPVVTLALKGNRTDLNLLNESNINVLSNVVNIREPGTHNLTYSVAYPGNIADNAVTVQSTSTDLITIKVENKISKNIPVEIDYGGTSVPTGFIADKENVQLSHTTIPVSGPESVMRNVEKAVIRVDLSQARELLIEECIYTLCDGEGNPVDAEMVTTEVEKVTVTLKIQRMKEIKLTLNVTDGGGATRKNSSININPKTIWVSGSDKDLEELETVELGSINLAEILSDQDLSYEIKLPEGVTNETAVTEAKVEIKFPQLQKKTFRITNITPVNVPEGLEVDVITEALDVTVRGPISDVEAMQETDISITVDFSGAQIGAATMKAQVTINSKYKDVGAIDTYQVSATLQEPVIEETEPATQSE
ncbi:MAG: hypothetical protein IJB47_04370 [Oscillospiraceae bacterium]|nr:hypothetical protein [Oscillospiraceae bacterium]